MKSFCKLCLEFLGCASLSQIRKSFSTSLSQTRKSFWKNKSQNDIFFFSWWFITRYHSLTALTCEKPPQIQISCWILSSSVALNLSLSAPVRSFRFITRRWRMMSCTRSPQLESRVIYLIMSDMWVPALRSTSGFCWTELTLTQSDGTVTVFLPAGLIAHQWWGNKSLGTTRRERFGWGYQLTLIFRYLLHASGSRRAHLSCYSAVWFSTQMSQQKAIPQLHRVAPLAVSNPLLHFTQVFVILNAACTRFNKNAMQKYHPNVIKMTIKIKQKVAWSDSWTQGCTTIWNPNSKCALTTSLCMKTETS